MSACIHMRSSVVKLAEQRPLGTFGWFVRYHLRHCKHCQEALSLLEHMLADLKEEQTTPYVAPQGFWEELESRSP